MCFIACYFHEDHIYRILRGCFSLINSSQIIRREAVCKARIPTTIKPKRREQENALHLNGLFSHFIYNVSGVQLIWENFNDKMHIHSRPFLTVCLASIHLVVYNVNLCIVVHLKLHIYSFNILSSYSFTINVRFFFCLISIQWDCFFCMRFVFFAYK